MVANFGLGIAASQVGIKKNIIVLDSSHLPSIPKDPVLADIIVC